MRRRLSCGILFVLTLFTALPCLSKVQTGFLDRTVTITGVTYRYQVYVPVDFQSKKKWPVILFLHGSGERGSDGLLQTDVGLPHAIRLDKSRFPFVVVIPQCEKEKIWGDPAMEIQALGALENSIKEFHGDRNHIYLSGLSMGGYGTWEFASRNPGRFAALVPICSGVRPIKDMPQLRVTKVDDARITDQYAEVARRVGSTPVWMFHGDVDQAVPVEESRKMSEAIKAAGGNVKYTEYPGVNHNSWDRAYAEPELVPWLLAQSLHH
jgi:predicted peptidase